MLPPTTSLTAFFTSKRNSKVVRRFDSGAQKQYLTKSPARSTTSARQRPRWGVGPGDRIAVQEYLPCWHCRWCLQGDFRLCVESDFFTKHEHDPSCTKCRPA